MNRTKRKHEKRLAKSWFNHRTWIPPDDGGPVTFQWHWPRGTFDARMSALELAEFLMPHMPHVLPFFVGHPRVYAQFEAMMIRFATWPKEALDELATWVKPVVRTGEDDLIELAIHNLQPQPAAPKVFSLS